MRRKLLALAVPLGLTLLASGMPRAEATTYPSCLTCGGKPAYTVCVCPAGTDWAGSYSNCGSWQRVGGSGCWNS